MHLWVRLVGKLLRDERIRLRSQFLSLADGARHTLMGRSEHQSGTQTAKQRATLDAHAVGHREDKLVATSGSHQSQSHACVAACGFDDDGVPAEKSLLLSLFDERIAHTVFHATSWVQILQLSQHACFQLLVFLHLAEFQQGGLAYQFYKALCDFCHDLIIYYKLYIIYYQGLPARCPRKCRPHPPSLRRVGSWCHARPFPVSADH